MRRGLNLIDGAWLPAAEARTFEQRNPANLDEVTGTHAASSPVDVEAAVAAAQRAFPAWRALSPLARKRYLDDAMREIVARRDEIARTITRENGKTLGEARTEVESGIREMDYQIAEGMRLFGETVPVDVGGTLAYTKREPRGPAAIVTPWNFPFNVPCRKITPALMAGNTVVLKPSSLTPGVGLLYAELLSSAGLPDGVLNCVTGAGRDVGDALIGDARIKAISFTGSTPVGQHIQRQAAANLTPAQLELGGKNPAIVMPDADLDVSVTEIVKGAFACAGQWCTSTSRVIVLDAIAAELTERLVAAAAGIVVGDGMAPDTGMGPVCGAAQKADVLRFVEIGQVEGARLLTGGAGLEDGIRARGCFVAPTLFDRVTPDMAIAREEIFGPVLVIIAVPTFDAALAVANDVAYGLSSSIFTRDLGAALTYLERAEVGLAHVNLMTALREAQLPFGGVKASGAGLPEAGSSGIEFFTQHKTCYVKYR